MRTTETGWLDRLNPEQRMAVTHGAEPLLIIAGAGSGKTNTLAHRVAWLVLGGADPTRILLLTFSRRAATEMTQRVERIGALAMAGAGAAAALAWAGTFHAVGARLLRDYAEAIGLPSGFTILDREDSADLMNIVRHELGFSRHEERFPTKGTCLAIYSRAVNAELPLAEVLRGAFPWCAALEPQLRDLFAAYVEAKQAQAVLDYDDLLLYWAQIMAEPALGADIAGRFDHVLVDEYQDTNRLQASILLALRPGGHGLTVVGDDAQSIYSFRSATVRNILDFPAAFDPPAAIVTLDRNYRSTQPILSAANAVIGLAAERFTKNLRSERPSTDLPELLTVRDEAEQARCVVEHVLAHREAGLSLKAQAALFRASHHSALLELELTRRNIPFVKFGGLKFLEAAHVKDMLAGLRFIENPRDRIAGFRLLQLLPGIGPATAGRFLDEVAVAADPVASVDGFAPPARAEGDWLRFRELFRNVRDAAAWPGELELLRRWYEPHLERLYDDAAVRSADLDQLAQIAAACPSRQRFLTDLTLDPPDASSGESGVPHRDEDYFILSTIHSAKGQEWNAVYILNGVDGCIPSDLGTDTAEELEEERRLLYVAMTRARDHLAVLLPQRFYPRQQPERGDRHVYAARTRFIPQALMPLFRAAFWPPVNGARPPPRGPIAPVDIGARMRAMWR